MALDLDDTSTRHPALTRHPAPDSLDEATTQAAPPGVSSPVDAARATGSTLPAPAMTSQAPPSPATWAPGAVIPGTIYRVIRPLGVGGMGEVYEAEHELLGVRRALKVLGRKLTSREDLAERLRIEARALARLRHPNLVEVNDLGVSADGRVFFAMELLAGATLRDLLRRVGKLRVDQAIAIAAQVLDALDAAHQEGMIHRDVKPENVFIQRSGVVKLLDFGVAKALQGNTQSSPLTAVGVAIGTPRYMAPEQAQGQPVDQRTDVYAVGLVLFEMLAGKTPYHHLDALAAVVTAASQGIPDVAEGGAVGVPDDVRQALARATARLPADRYRAAAAFAADLRAAGARLSGAPPSSAEKITARYETSLTSLMPVLGDVDDPAGATPSSGLSAFTRPSNTEPDAGDSPRLMTTSEVAIRNPTEVMMLRESLPFDPRSAPTPTAVPALPPASPSAPPPAPSPPPAPAAPRALWLSLPLSVALSVGLTWWLARPPQPAPAPQPVASAAAPTAEPPAPRPAATLVASPAESAPPQAAQAPQALAAASAAPQPAAKNTLKPVKTYPAKAKTNLPGSGL